MTNKHLFDVLKFTFLKNNRLEIEFKYKEILSGKYEISAGIYDSIFLGNIRLLYKGVLWKVLVLKPEYIEVHKDEVRLIVCDRFQLENNITLYQEGYILL